ncbi:DEAD/DEAH box helicase [Pasteurella multocida]|uniref:DEAD/DEAH box helicase n=3 Tax=Pasteurella multocida TaxID=747 RepID=UPI00099DA087|nr:DEAD/DEAH box helicase family protein [Pasteurella multocida]MCL7823977.1 DEAD/DEAH box helicase family protein [Pasteurella multocida]MCL7828435.1 DEAD/DEAH box helicase family protein [Pasteurella multocida]MCL7832135.1 DEAD/DEAH box helicase family protein [Pasteurella multocida]OPC87109.1 helicase [Pasteurella multocida subsp. multocida]HDR1103172.1 DEAD/DEAH box helicase family protein [Pasteurella multocida]
MQYFKTTPVNIIGNNKLRTPQIEAYINIKEYFHQNPTGEALVVLPTGTGKSGLISIAPFDVSNGRVLIITPGLITKNSIKKTQEALQDNFWINYDIIFSIDNLPVLSEYESGISNEHLEQSHIIFSNIHKLASSRSSSLINRVPSDFFDMIIIDESHHAPAESWKKVLEYFPNAKKLHVTGTPYRGDNQELPGEKIHETPLSEVMRARYVKLLRKETVNAHELYFTLPESPDKQLTLEEVMELKEQEWIEKCVSLSKDCSLDVIDRSIEQFNSLKELSPKVPHKILAVGCSIKHAEDIASWYKEKGMNVVIIHSDMPYEEQQDVLMRIENHQCNVVVSVNMLMEGYDHRYLTVLALFRPYRSINAFAQIVGRVLRVIPDNEIRAFEIDNNAVVIFHEESGLNKMWEVFQKEVERSKCQISKEYNVEISDEAYEKRKIALGNISSEGRYLSNQDSYLDDIDFNKLFEQKRQELKNEVHELTAKLPIDTDPIYIEALKKAAERKINQEVDETLVHKRPAQARKELRKILTSKAQNSAADLLSDLNIDAKEKTLYYKFNRLLSRITPDTTNDGVIVMYINSKLYSKFGSVDSRDNDTLQKSIKEIDSIMIELRRMLA